MFESSLLYTAGYGEPLQYSEEMGNTKSQHEFNAPWRKTTWGKKKKDDLIQGIKGIEPTKKDLKCLRVLMVGPCGSGKSSFINSVNNAFKGRITSDALSDRTCGKSFTVEYKPCKIESGHSSLSVVFNDIMGLEPGCKQGCPVEDIIKAIHGHIRHGHVFNPEKPLSSEDEDYVTDPSLSDEAFCLVYVLAADRIQLTDSSVLEKMKDIRMQVRTLALPQVMLLTNVDQACPLVDANLQRIYYSKKIKEKMEWCSNALGVPMCHAFPVKNYHEEIETNDDMDVLILQALHQIIQVANDNLQARSTNNY